MRCLSRRRARLPCAAAGRAALRLRPLAACGRLQRWLPASARGWPAATRLRLSATLGVGRPQDLSCNRHLIPLSFPGSAPCPSLPPQVTDDLKNFLTTNLPKAKKGGAAKFKLGVAEAKLGSAIQVL